MASKEKAKAGAGAGAKEDGRGFDASDFLAKVAEGPDVTLFHLCQRASLGPAVEALLASAIKEAMAAGADPSSAESKAGGDGPLARLASSGRWRSLEALLACGARPDEGHEKFAHAYAQAAREAGPARIRSDDAERCMMALIRAGSDPNLPLNERGCLPLTAAMGSGLVEVVKALLLAGANPNAVDPVFGSPLTELAASRTLQREQFEEVFVALRSAGADPWQATANGVLIDARLGARGLGKTGPELLVALLGANTNIPRPWKMERQEWLACEMEAMKIAKAARPKEGAGEKGAGAKTKRRPGL